MTTDPAPSPGPQPATTPGPPPVRAGSAWLALREPADAAARSVELVEALSSRLPTGRTLQVHDLGSGTGSMARWLAPRLARPQHWVLHDRDEDLLHEVASARRPVAGDGSAVTLETRSGDVTRLEEADLAGADLITASALLDMLTAAEVTRLVETCARAGCLVLITLSVVGHVELAPPDPLDETVEEAFNAHQRRVLDTHPLLGPDAARSAADAFAERGFEVTTRPSPWVLGPQHSALVREWLRGWLDAAYEHRPGLREVFGDYERRRVTEAAAGRLSVAVHHEDLLAAPPDRIR